MMNENLSRLTVQITKHAAGIEEPAIADASSIF
jgi:hypothetical protein